MIKHPEYNYVDSAFGSVSKRNNVVSVEEFESKLANSQGEVYRSVFRFTKDYLDLCTKTGTVSGFSGSCYADYLPFDFDSPVRADAYKEVLKFVAYLMSTFDLDPKHIRYYFSGNKGFHLLIPSEVFGGFEPSPRLPQVFKQIAQDITNGLNVDLGIYDINRLLRAPNSKHKDSKLFKIPITPDDMFSQEEPIKFIESMAKTKCEVNIQTEYKVCPGLQIIYQKYKSGVIAPVVIAKSRKKEGLTEVKKPCISQLLNGVQEGNRNNAAMRITDYLKKEGFSRNLTTGMLIAWNSSNSKLMSNDEIMKVVNSVYDGVYDFGCKDHMLRSICGDNCIFKDSEVSSDDIKSMSELEDLYKQYVKNLHNEKITFDNWIPRLGKAINGLCPGEVMLIIAGTGVGKTALAQNLMKTVNLPSLFMSLELPENLVFQRFMQIGERVDGRTVEMGYMEDTFSVDIEEKYGNIYVVSKASRNINQIREYVRITEDEKARTKLKLLTIDYLGLLEGDGFNIYERVSKIAREMKALAKDTNTAVIVLSQTSRKYSSGSEVLSIDAARDSGAIEEGADFVIGAWRPDIKDGDIDRTMVLGILKNRKGPTGVRITCNWEPKTLRITERTLQEVDQEEMSDEDIDKTLADLVSKKKDKNEG